MIAGITLSAALELGELQSSPGVSNEQLATSELRGIAIDSRQVEAGYVFVALPGEHADGHDFVEQARARGAVAAIVEHFVDSALPQIKVANAARALAALAGSIRERFQGAVLAITGSSGKTSVKNLTRLLLAGFGSVSATAGNLNNELGVPLTIAAIDAKADFAVIEMGAAESGDIAYLVDFARPQIALVNNVGHAHVGRFGSIDITAKTKAEIYSKLGGSDTAVVNLDDRYATAYIEMLNAAADAPRVLTFSVNRSDANIFAQDLQQRDDGRFDFELFIRTGSSGASMAVSNAESSVRLTAPQPGLHSVANLLAATALCVAAGIDAAKLVARLSRADEVFAELASASAANGRLATVLSNEHYELIDDSYNANPESLRAAVEHLVMLAEQKQRRSLLLLGDMAELGEASAALHRELGGYAAKQGVSCLLATGQYAQDYVDGFSSLQADGTGTNGFSAKACASQAELLAECGGLAAELMPLVVLVKGSRSAAMEQVVSQLGEVLDSGAVVC